MRRGVKLLAIAILAAHPLLTQDNAMEIPREAAETYRHLNRFHLEWTYESELIGELSRTWQKYVNEAAMDGTDRLRVSFRGSYDWNVAVSHNGTTVWHSQPRCKEFATKPAVSPVFKAKSDPRNRDAAIDGMRRFLRDTMGGIAERVKSAKVLREEPAEISGQEHGCYVIQASYGPRPGDLRTLEETRTFWIDKERSIVPREESSRRGAFVGSDPNTVLDGRSKTLFTTVAISEPLPDELFIFVPPEGAMEVDRVSRRCGEVLMTGKPAPDFTAKTLEGVEVSLGQFRGRPVLLHFWASWCSPCRRQMPVLAEIVRDTRDTRLMVLGASTDREAEAAAEYWKQKGNTWPSVLDESGAMMKQYGAERIPMVFLINPEGTIMVHAIGYGEGMESEVRAALGKLGVFPSP